VSDYADTSFILSLHLAVDVNHARAARFARTWSTPPHLPLTDFGTYEATNALMQLVARRLLTLTEATALVREVAGGRPPAFFVMPLSITRRGFAVRMNWPWPSHRARMFARSTYCTSRPRKCSARGVSSPSTRTNSVPPAQPG